MAEINVNPENIRGLESSLFRGLSEDQKRAVRQWRLSGISEEEILRRMIQWRA